MKLRKQANLYGKNVQQFMAVVFVPGKSRLQARCFDMEYTYKYLFVNRVSGKQLNVLTPKTSSNRIILLLLAWDI